MQPKCLIIGGGLAGLSAAACLANSGIGAELLEASPKLGGRAYSFTEAHSGDVIDNGQHIMMGCYHETLSFLRLIGSEGKLKVQKNLSVNFVSKTLGLTPLKARNAFYPFNLLLGIMSYKALKFSERLEIISLCSKLLFLRTESLEDLTVLQWLKKERQSPGTIKAFWEILSTGALNTDISRASAAIFASILKEMFLKGSRAASIILPRTGLSGLYCQDSADFICRHGGNITLSEPVKSVEIQNNKIIKIILQNRELTDFDFVISAVPYHSFSRIFPGEFVRSLSLEGIAYSAILSLNLWLTENPFKEEFYGLIDSPVHWVFNHGKFISIVISNADEISGRRSSQELQEIIFSELEKFFPRFHRGLVSAAKLIREKRATFIPSPEIIKHRPKTYSSIENLFLAGDWTQTGLPATIEGAVKSGRNAASAVLKSVK